jgi:hypothetical protein
MNYQMHFDPYLSKHLNQRGEELVQEMEHLRLKERLRADRRSSALQLVALTRRGVLPLLRAAHLAG